MRAEGHVIDYEAGKIGYKHGSSFKFGRSIQIVEMVVPAVCPVKMCDRNLVENLVEEEATQGHDEPEGMYLRKFIGVDITVRITTRRRRVRRAIGPGNFRER